MKRWIIPLTILLALSFILASCSSGTTATSSTTTTTSAPTTTTPVTTSTSSASTTPSSTTSSSPSITPKAGGTLVMLLANEPFTFFPAAMTGQTDGQTSSVCLETLFRFDKDSNLVPLLATDWKADASAKTITITLRQNVKFHDGSDFNAEVAKWNLEQFKAGTRPELKKVASIDVVDDHTVRLNLSQFDNTIVTNMANGTDAARMISQKAFEANGGKDWAAKNPVGTGPFQFISYTKDVGIKWKRFDGYWGGKPYLDGIEMKRIADQTVALMEFKAGNLDILGTVAPPDAKGLLADPAKYKVVKPPMGQVPALAGNCSDPNSPFNKLEVRQAISHAIDVKTFNDSFGAGFWTVMNQWAVPGTWGYSPDVKGYAYDPEKSKQLLTAAGITLPLKTTLNFNNTSQSVVDENTALQSYLNKAGFDVTLNPMQRPAFADAATNMKGWDGIIRQQGFSNPDPLIKYAGVMSGQEFKGTLLPAEMVDLYNKAISTPDFATKQTLTRQLMVLAVDKYCIATYLDVQASPSAKSTVVHDDLFQEVPFSYLSPMTWISR